MIRRPPRSTQGVSSAASDVYKRQEGRLQLSHDAVLQDWHPLVAPVLECTRRAGLCVLLSLIHISEPTRPY